MKTKTKVLLSIIIVNIISISLSILYYVQSDNFDIFFTTFVIFMLSSIPGSIMYYKRYSNKPLDTINDFSYDIDSLLILIILFAPYYCFKYLYLENKNNY